LESSQFASGTISPFLIWTASRERSFWQDLDTAALTVRYIGNIGPERNLDPPAPDGITPPFFPAVCLTKVMLDFDTPVRAKILTRVTEA
jgi:hypothetical protein